MTPFFKLSGAGNDFIALVEPPQEPESKQIRGWCRPRLSLGADGLFTLRRETGAVRLVYFNADGRRASLCLNASRCAARLASHLGWCDREVTVRTDSGDLFAEIVDVDSVRITAPPAGDVEWCEVVSGADRFAGARVDVGVPHFAVFHDGPLSEIDVMGQGAFLRSHPRFGGEGSNVDFVRLRSSRSLEIRSYERGVEGETLACGTGVLAVTAAAVASRRATLPLRVRTQGGFVFEVDGVVDLDQISAWTLTGDARLVAEGNLLPGALKTF